eukprot:3259031-Alexandrium_andersonii.AAC.1
MDVSIFCPPARARNHASHPLWAPQYPLWAQSGAQRGCKGYGAGVGARAAGRKIGFLYIKAPFI